LVFFWDRSSSDQPSIGLRPFLNVNEHKKGNLSQIKHTGLALGTKVDSDVLTTWEPNQLMAQRKHPTCGNLKFIAAANFMPSGQVWFVGVPNTLQILKISSVSLEPGNRGRRV
jgi:hypothetical protein